MTKRGKKRARKQKTYIQCNPREKKPRKKENEMPGGDWQWQIQGLKDQGRHKSATGKPSRMGIRNAQGKKGENFQMNRLNTTWQLRGQGRLKKMYFHETREYPALFNVPVSRWRIRDQTCKKPSVLNLKKMEYSLSWLTFFVCSVDEG